MIEKDITNENKEFIYSYKDEVGIRYFTPNVNLAHARAAVLGTNSVYATSYDVPPMEEKPKNYLTN